MLYCEITVAPCLSDIDHPLSLSLQVVEGQYGYQQDIHSIYNTPAIAMLIRWLLTLNSDLCEWLSCRLYDMCSYGAHNKQRCCTAGLITVVTEVLAASQEEDKPFTEEVEGRGFP